MRPFSIILSGLGSPRLPTELLLTVIEYFHNEPKTLSKLFRVNSFFLHAAAKLMYADPFKHASTTRSHFELVSLLLASAIHTQRRYSKSWSSLRGDKPFTATEFLSAFGLGLSEQCAPTPLLQDAILGIKPITTSIDYAQYLKQNTLGKESGNEITSALPVVPQQLVGSVLHTTVFDIRGHPRRVDNLTGDRSAEFVIQASNSHLAWRRVGILLLWCYAENFETITLDVSSSKWYYPLADKLPLLKTVCVGQTIGNEESDLKEAASFFVKHRLAFPHKRPVHLDFHEWQTSYMPSQWHPISGVTGDNLRDLQRSRIELYKAVATPVHMDASTIPDFYDSIIQDTGLDLLETFVDEDSLRGKYENPCSQRIFLQQCHNLRTLNIAICEPDLFKWAQDSSDSAIQGQMTAHWSKLQSLSLHLFSHPAVLSQALAACGQSLRTLDVNGCEPRQTQPQGELSRARPVEFGHWTFPYLRNIEVNILLTSPIHVGDLSGCPLLESLRLSLAFVCEHVHLYPVWKLPRLQRLELEGAPVLEFNFDSFDHFPELRIVTLTTRTLDCHFVSSYAGIPIMSHREPRSQVPDNNQVPDNSYDVLEVLNLARHPWTTYCNLPSLRKMTLNGPLSSAFCLNWLDGNPALESLELVNFESCYRNILSCSREAVNVLSMKLPIGGVHAQIPPFLHPRSRFGSKLKTIKFKGPWMISEDALLNLLTIYAPNLTELCVERINNVPPRMARDTEHGGRVVRMLLNILQSSRDLGWERESTGGAEAGTTSATVAATVPGGALRSFTCGYKLSKRDKKSIALYGVSNKNIKEYRKAGILVISMCGQCYVRQVDRIIR
ncbi:hypothetical protein BGZ93_010915 [Podila epicladia]|nr:hypothetical protein BGZ93_010915 [Podila epicladia]